MIYSYTIPALLLAFLIDQLLGDPQWFPHPVRFFGWLINSGEKRLLRENLPQTTLVRRGTVMSICVVLIAWAVPAVALWACSRVNFVLWFCVETALCWTVLAVKSLRMESVKIYHTLQSGDVQLARQQLSMIVGRDTEQLQEEGIAKAVVETVAENTADGVTAPLFYAGIGGAPLGLMYKAVNTLDSMIGYKNNKYLHFGRFAAKLDDVFNFIPARLTALWMVLAAYVLGLDGKNAWRIYLRDRKNHASPNSAQTESVCAGALGVQLAGNAQYFGKVVKKPAIGDACRAIEPDDIRRANRLMVVTSVFMLLFVTVVKFCVLFFISGGTLWVL